MLFNCPVCQTEVIGDPPDRCPICGGGLIAPDQESGAQATGELLSPGVPDEPLAAQPTPSAEMGFWWAALVLFITTAFATGVAYIQGGILFTILPRTQEGDDIATSLGFLPIGLISLAVAWLCLQPHPWRTLAPSRVRYVHVFIGITAAIAFTFTWAGFEALFTRKVAPLPGVWESLLNWIDSERHYYAYRVLAMQPWLAVIFIGCVVPAICEGIFFRGYLGRGLVARFGAVQGVLLTSLLFGLVHFEPWHVLGAFVSGILFHTLFLGSKSIFVPMSAHFTGNLIAYSLMKLEQDGTLSYSFSDTLSEPFVAAAATCYLAASLLLLWRTPCDWQPTEDASAPVEPAVEQRTTGSLVGASGGLAWPVAAVSGLCFIAAFANAARPEWAILSVKRTIDPNPPLRPAASQLQTRIST